MIVTVPDYAPWLAALVGSWATPTPRALATMVGALPSLLKGALTSMSFSADDIKSAIKECQALVSLGLNYVEGDTPDAKAKTLTDEIQPIFAAAIAQLNLPGIVTGFANTVLGWMIAAEVKAALATKAAEPAPAG